MDSKVVVVPFKADSEDLFRVSQSGTHCSIRTEQYSLQVKDGFLNKVTKSGFLTMELSVAESLIETGLLTVGTLVEDVIGSPCKLVVTESTEPSYETQSPKINPSTGEVLVNAEGKAIYRSVNISTNLEEKDTYIPHKVKEKAPQAQQATKTSEEFGG